MTKTNTQPDASRLVYRIKTALKGESVGLETARLAWQYAVAIDTANAQLKSSVAALESSPIEAYLKSEFSPRLLDTVDTLDFSEKEAWTERCKVFGWKSPDSLDFETSQKLRDAFSDKEEPKEWLYTEYRENARAKKNNDAFTIIKLLAEKFEDDANIQEEFKRQNERIQERASKEIENALGELIASESVPAVLKRYREFGYEFTAKEGPIHSALEAESASQTKQATEAAKSVIKAGKTLEGSGDWQKVEEQYLKCEYALATDGTRAKIDPTLRDEFNKVGTALSRSRGAFESDILIREAIDQLRLALSGKTKTNDGKALTARDAVERIKSLEAQAKKMGHRFTAALQSEITAAYGEAKRNNLPRIAMFGGGALAALLIVFFSVSSYTENAAKEAEIENALKALDDAQTKQSARDSSQALSEWKRVIDSTDSSEPLVSKAQEVETWLNQQKVLESEYKSIVSSLNAIQAGGIGSEDSSQTLQLLGRAEDLRKELASELGNNEEEAVNSFVAWREVALKQQARLMVSSFDRLLKSAIDRVEQARSARGQQSFTTHSKAASEALFQAERILIDHKPDLGSREPQKEIASITTDLDGLQSKWSALASVQRKLSSSKTLDGYFAELKRIQSFDITPRDDKSAITRVLKQQDAFGQLKLASVLPDDLNARRQFDAAISYMKATPIPSSAEQAYLERLANDPSFGSVYKSRVQYFEGELAAKSEYYVFLTQEIEFSQTPVKSGTSFTFKVHGYDEFGDPEGSVREMNFLTRTDGTAWGFRYYPSELSAESLYYEETLRVLFLQVLSGAPRLALIKQLDDLNKNRSLTPAFRAYWQQQIFTFLKLDPWKWGLALAPTLQEQSENLDRIGRGGIPQQQWLSSVEQTAPSLEFTQFFRNVYRLDVLNETVALATLYEEALKGNFELVGIADASGRAQISDPKALRENKWAVHSRTGRIEALESDLNLAPYSPILVYRFDGKDADRLFQGVELQTDVDLTESKFTKHLPAILQ